MSETRQFLCEKCHLEEEGPVNVVKVCLCGRVMFPLPTVLEWLKIKHGNDAGSSPGAPQMMNEPLPDGYRLLRPGEVLQAGDIYLSTSGKWSPSPIIGAAVQDNGVSWARKEEKGDSRSTY